MKTKIICTLGPSSYPAKILKQLKLLKISIFRINLSHTKVEDLPKIIRYLLKKNVKNICIDTEGAQIRTTKTDKKIFFKKNKIVSIKNLNRKSNRKIINLYPNFSFKKIKINTTIKIGFNNLKLKVIFKNKELNLIKAKVLNTGFLESNKGVHFDPPISLPPLTAKDIKAIEIAKKYKIKYFAMSFVNRESDIKEIRKLIFKNDFLISKIETNNSIKNLSKIIQKSNAILIDRGDLSRYVRISKIPLAQNIILQKARKFKKEVYIATNLLENMVQNYEPTRAESNDIYSCISKNISGLVLAAETAIGKNPVECVKFLLESLKVKSQEKLIKRNISYLFK